MSPRRTDPKFKTQTPTRRVPDWLIAVGIGVAVVIGVVVLFTLQTPQPVTYSPVGVTSSGKTKGDPNAKLDLIVFSDFKCPHCMLFAADVERRIDEAYVKTGKVKITYKYFLVVDPNGESLWSANAAECANEQGRFWDYHDKIVAESPGGRNSLTRANLKKYAADLRLDTARFDACFDSNKYNAMVQADVNEAQRLGLPGTPSFILNGRRMNLTSLEYSEFARTFDVLLK
jgi:protein-disulfide isomerase